MASRGRAFDEFDIRVELSDGLALLRLRGSVDVATATEFGVALADVLVPGGLSVVLDVAELRFIDASGLGVIARASRLARYSGGELTIRSPSPMLRRLLDITALSDLLESEPSQIGASHLGPEQVMEVGRNAPGAGWSKLSALPADDDVVDGALRLVVALARATVGGADGVSVSLRRHGVLATVAASDQTILDMDADQYATGEGPCVDASVQGHWFHAEALDTETRWPAFTPRARELGINAILSSPLLARDQPVGALNIYSRTATAFAPQDQELAAVFATEASTILTGAGLDVSDEARAGRMHEALRGREIIAQAQGVMMERTGATEDEAFSLLRRFSVGTGTPLRARAFDVIESTRPARPLRDGQTGGRP